MSILNTIKDLGIVQVVDSPMTEPTYIQSLEYVTMDSDVNFDNQTGVQTGIDAQELLKAGKASFVDLVETPGTWEETPISKQLEEVPYKKVSLVLNKSRVEFTKEFVRINDPGIMDQFEAVTDHLLRQTVGELQLLADKSSAEANFTGKERLIPTVLTASNVIAKRCRRGQANFVIANKRNIDSMALSTQDAFIYENKPFNFGMKMLVCEELGDKVIVGRMGNKDEPGLRLLSNEKSLTEDVQFGATDILGVHIKYALDSSRESDRLNYLSFTFKQ